MALLNVSVEGTAGGASGEVDGMRDPEPMCMHKTVAVSSQAANNGSQWPSASWMDGSPRLVGSSVKATAWAPRSALRRTSAAARWGSHRGIRGSGMSRLPVPPHHSSIIQSL